MKYNFGDSNVITCYIKELLHSFNLPRYPIYTKELEESDSLYENRIYIKDGLITKYVNGKFKKLAEYIYNYPMINFTKKFIIKSSIYDDYTHQYLGDYLRFLRDYFDVDLMSMYNCFSAKEPGRISLVNDNGRPGVSINNDFKFEIDTDKNDFIYYIVPVKFDQTYTIAANINSGYDIACILYGNIYASNTPDDLIKQSFKHIDGSVFTKPFTYSTKFTCTKEKELWAHEKDLKMILKLPKTINTSIVVLEGDYVSNSNVIDGCLYTTVKTNIKKESIGDKYIYKNIPKNFITKLSLLELDDKLNHPFADKLVEYLLMNAITSMETIPNNIEYVQDMLYPIGLKGQYGLWDDILRYDIHQRTLMDDLLKGKGNFKSNSILEFDNDSLNLSENAKIKYVFNAPSFKTITYDLVTGKEIIAYENIKSNTQFELRGDDIFIIKCEITTEDGQTIEIDAGSFGDGTIINNMTNDFIINQLNIDDYKYPEEGNPGSDEYVFTDLTIGKGQALQVCETSEQNRKIRFIDTHYDTLGYVDKDVESLLKMQLNAVKGGN